MALASAIRRYLKKVVLEHGWPKGPINAVAIVNQSVLYARDVKTSGFKMALQSSTEAGSVAGPDIREYSSHSVKKLFDSPTNSLSLPIKPEPVCRQHFRRSREGGEIRARARARPRSYTVMRREKPDAEAEARRILRL